MFNILYMYQYKMAIAKNIIVHWEESTMNKLK